MDGQPKKFQEKLKTVKSHLNCWNGDIFGNISQKKETLLKQTADLDSKESEHAPGKRKYSFETRQKENWKTLYSRKKFVGDKNLDYNG